MRLGKGGRKRRRKKGRGERIKGGRRRKKVDAYIRSLDTQAIEWEHIDYFNNAVICELIEHVSFKQTSHGHCSTQS